MLYIFDLGNVLINIDFNRALAVFSQYSGVPLGELQAKFSMDETFCLHEKGLISDQEFALHINQSLGIQLSFDQFIEGWCALLIDIRPGIIELLSSLKSQNHTLVMLSNTNNAHTIFWKNSFSELLPFFDRLFLSHELGMRKPEPEIYLSVLDSMEYTKNNALFFDDNSKNIEGAQLVGLPSLQIKNHSDLIDYFNTIGR